MGRHAGERGSGQATQAYLGAPTVYPDDDFFLFTVFLTVPRRAPAGCELVMLGTRKEARSLENQLDAKLVQYSRLDNADSGTNSFSVERESPVMLQRDIEQLLVQLAEINDKMSRQMNGGGGVAAAMHVLQRHREILRDFTQEFSKTKANLKILDERNLLLSSVQQDIRESRNTGSDILLRERTALQNTCRMTDELVGQATGQLSVLNEQRSVFGGLSSKLTDLAAVSPQINAMVGFIARRQKRDKLVLVVAIGVCIGLLLLYG